MCERLVIPGRDEVETDISVGHSWWTFSTRFNVAVNQSVPVARLHGAESEGVMMRWGLVPATRYGADRPATAPPGDASVASTAIEATAEYRTLWLYGQRCIVPLSGFYLWERSEHGHRQPHYVRLVNRPVFAVAALWDRLVTQDDDVIEGCALITVPANTLLAQVHPGGTMPAILHREDYGSWLQGRPAEARVLLQPYPPERMVMHAVGPHVNFAQYDDPGLIRPIR